MNAASIFAVFLTVAGCSRRAAPPAPVAAPAPAAAPAISAEDGAALVVDNCLSCHGADVIEQQRLTEAQWDATIEKMRGWGSPLEAEDAPRLRAHLSARRGPGAAPYVALRLTSAEASALVEPTEDGALGHGNPARGAALYRERCVLCHGADARGGTLGVNLTDRYLLHRAGDFARVVRTGRGRMPALPDTKDSELGDLLAYLRTL